MKKDRNTFFENSSMNMAFNAQTPQMMPMMYPAQAQAQASQSFYQSTGTPMMSPMPQYGVTNNDSTINELESRMAKLERSMNRLENRVSKLEGSTYYSTDNYDNTSGGMYMV